MILIFGYFQTFHPDLEWADPGQPYRVAEIDLKQILSVLIPNKTGTALPGQDRKEEVGRLITVEFQKIGF